MPASRSWGPPTLCIQLYDHRTSLGGGAPHGCDLRGSGVDLAWVRMAPSHALREAIAYARVLALILAMRQAKNDVSGAMTGEDRWLLVRLARRSSLARVSALLIPCLASGLFAFSAQSASVEDATPPPVSGRRLSAPETIMSADVFARVELLRDTVDLLRRYMGKPEPSAPLMRVENARPMEVYSQALNLQLRANRLAFEQVRVVRSESVPLSSEAAPSSVFAVVDEALASLLMVKRHLGIVDAVGEEIKPESTMPSEVFNATVTASSEIDNLLEQRTSPSDAFQLATAAVHIAATLHATIPGGPSLPSEPAFEPNRMPSDVYMRMQTCFRMVRSLASLRGLAMLRFELSDEHARQVSPGDVSDMASLVVEELTSLHVLYPGARTPARAYYPGARFPAHVYQRVGLLEAILRDLVATSEGG